MIQHVVCVCHLSILVADDWESQAATGYLIDVLNPTTVRIYCVRRKTDQLNAALGKFWL